MGGHKASMDPGSMQRVKVYRLTDDGKWDDKGTGRVTFDYMEGIDVGLVVIDEEDSDPLLMHRICVEDVYRKQEDTIISWRDPEFATELALSFQDSAGCTIIWDHIVTARRNLQFTAPDENTPNNKSGLKELPVVEISTLPQLLKIITESGRADQIRLTELFVNDQEFFKKLMDLFRNCEELDNKDALHMIYKIVKGIILFNSSQIFEKIFGDDLLMNIIGSLEYNPEVKDAQHHREFLKNGVVFQEAMPIKDPVVLSKIHQTYRIGYLKDIILPKVLDEATISILSSMILSNNATVVTLLKDDTAFIQELLAKLKSSTTSGESKKKLVFFLYEFCSISKSLPGMQQNRLFRDLAIEGIFDVITDVLQSEDKRLVLKGTDILMLFLNEVPNLLRNFVIRQEGNLLLGLLVNGVVTDFGEDMNGQFLEIIRSFLNTDALPATKKDTIVEIFFDKHLTQLVDCIIWASSSGGSKPEILFNICELLCYSVVHHPYRIKCNFLLNNLVEGVLFLTQRKEKYLVVAAVRFVRAILSHHDEPLIDHFVNNNILEPVVDAFVANGNRYNVLHSAVLDLFEYIWKENLQLLVRYIVESFWNQLVRFENLACIQSLKTKYDQILEDMDTKTNSYIINSLNHTVECTLGKDVEKTSNGNSSNFAGLVDYDDDDEDYQPPSKKHSKSSKSVGSVVESARLKRKLRDMNKNLESKKKLLYKYLKSDDIVTDPSCSAISQQKLANEEKPDPALDDKRKCTEKSGCSMSVLEQNSSVGCGSSDSEHVKGNSTCPDKFDCHNNTLSNENPDGKENDGEQPDCQDSLSNNQMYVEIEEHIEHDPWIPTSNPSFIKGREKDEGCHLDDSMQNTHGSEPNVGLIDMKNVAEE